MRQAIAAAEVGDEQRGEDRTTLRLQERVAELLGQEAGLFMPSGTMCNQISFRLHARPGGDELILDRSAHPIIAEAGGPASNAQLMIHALEGESGIFTADQVRAAIRPDSRYMPRSRIVSVEQTTNMGGGAVWPLEAIRSVLEVAREHGLRAHMDGARLMNAVVASGAPGDRARGRLRHRLDRLHQGARRAGGGRALRLARADRGGLALEAADGRSVSAVGHRRRGLPLRARPQRRAARRGPRERTRPGRRPGRAGLRGGRAPDEHRDLLGAGRLRGGDGRTRGRVVGHAGRPRPGRHAPRRGPRGNRAALGAARSCC